jgi:glycosyltransferase involved in cell wall biosynthesis
VTVAIVHDYLTQRGGAERVVLSMLKAFPRAPLHTSLYDHTGTFSDFERADVRACGLSRIGVLRRKHRLALPLLAPAFDRLRVTADVAICSSSGWAHGATVMGRKIVYCHTPARWLYQPERYLRSRAAARVPLAVLRPYLLRWDRRAAATADLYLANSSVVRDRIWRAYGVSAEIVSPPHAADPSAPQRPVAGIRPDFFLCVSRLLPYKNVDAVIAAFGGLPHERLVVVGSGPDRARLQAASTANVRLLGAVDDLQLRWLYANCVGVLCASYEDFGLTPLEAAAFGRPAAVLRWGGFLDTVVEGKTGIFFEQPHAREVREAVLRLRARPWDDTALRTQAAHFSEAGFIARLTELVEAYEPPALERRELALAEAVGT